MHDLFGNRVEDAEYGIYDDEVDYSPFDDMLTLPEFFGNEQWDECSTVVDRAHLGTEEENRHYRKISFYIPTGFHHLWAYLEYKKGNLLEKDWVEYYESYPHRYKGARNVDGIVRNSIQRLINNTSHHHLHWFAIGAHWALEPRQFELPFVDEDKTVIGADPKFQSAINLLWEALRTLIVNSKEETTIGEIISSINSLNTDQDDVQILQDIIKFAYNRDKPANKKTVVDEIPF